MCVCVCVCALHTISARGSRGVVELTADRVELRGVDGGELRRDTVAERRETREGHTAAVVAARQGGDDEDGEKEERKEKINIICLSEESVINSKERYMMYSQTVANFSIGSFERYSS